MEGIKATREEIEHFLSIQKYDYSSDCGSDYGDGCGYGKEYCNGGKRCYTSGSGCGSGAGSGSANGYGDGSG